MPRQFDKVECTRGAPMGRSHYGNINTVQVRVSLFHVQLNQGYDDGGA